MWEGPAAVREVANRSARQLNAVSKSAEWRIGDESDCAGLARTTGAPGTARWRGVDHRRCAIVVAGMHRSGTSACAEVLGRLGADLPRRIVPADRSNRRGHFEPRVIVRLNERLLAAAGSSWADWRMLDDAALDRRDCKALIRALNRSVQAEFFGKDYPLIKDPRICRMSGLWRRLLAGLGYETFFVLPYRHPTAVAASLMKRDGLDREYSYLLWLRHVLEAERATRCAARAFLDYEWMLTHPSSMVGWTTERLPVSADGSRVIEHACDAVDPRLRNHRTRVPEKGEGPQLALCASEAYTALHADPNDINARAVLDVIRGCVDSAQLELVPPDTAMDDLARYSGAVLAAADQAFLAGTRLSHSSALPSVDGAQPHEVPTAAQLGEER